MPERDSGASASNKILLLPFISASFYGFITVCIMVSKLSYVGDVVISLDKSLDQSR